MVRVKTMNAMKKSSNMGIVIRRGGFGATCSTEIENRVANGAPLLLNLRRSGSVTTIEIRSWVGPEMGERIRRIKRRRIMRKLAIWGGILGGTVFVFLALTVWALIWGIGILRERLPTWVGGGEKFLSAAIIKAEEILPGVKEKVKEVAPGLKEMVEKLTPGIEVPGKDVGGEDIKPIARHENMIRVSYSMENQKKIVSYRGKVDFGAAKEFYRKEMVALGFQEKALRASPAEEIYQFKKGSQNLEFRFRKITVVLAEYTELTIKEL
jgi:hypothetical protein